MSNDWKSNNYFGAFRFLSNCKYRETSMKNRYKYEYSE